MDLNQAIQKHAEWKIKFRTAIGKQETMDDVTIGKDDCCELGKWLHGEAKARFTTLVSYSPCVARHAEFHTEAGKVARAINAKKYAEAQAMLGPETVYASASQAVAMAIMKLQKEARL